MPATKKSPPKRKRTKKAAQPAVHLSFLIDESGSMAHNRLSVIEGYNEFVQAMAAEEGDIRATLGLFDSNEPMLRIPFDGIPIQEVPPLTPHDYRPAAYTPLNDAVYGTIRALEAKAEEGDRALVVIVTDGLENASREVTADQVRELVQAKEAEGWAFIYLGANHDAWDQGGSIGVAAGQTFAYTGTKRGTSMAFRAAKNMGVGYLSDNATFHAVASATPSHLGEDLPDPPAEDTSVSDAIGRAREVLS